MASADDVLQTALQLSPNERARLAHSLIESLDEGGNDDDVEEAWAAEISSRISSPDEASEVWSVVRERVLESLTRKP